MKTVMVTQQKLSCDKYNGEIFNLYYLTTQKKNAKHLCPDCVRLSKKPRKKKLNIGFKFYDVECLN